MEQQLAQEVRRQDILQQMGLEVWLPRQQLPYAAPTPDWLLQWQPAPTPAQSAPVTQPPTASTPAAAPTTSQTSTAARPATNSSARDSLQQLRQTLQTETPPAPAVATPDTPAADHGQPQAAPQPASSIPHFSLQLLRSGSCLLLVDLSMGEPFQARDPEYVLLKDILRAARLSDAPSMLRNAEPISWPLLRNDSLPVTQDALQARAYVRELLLQELDLHPASLIWLMGEQACSFANPDATSIEQFSLSQFDAGVQCWNLPGLDQLMQHQQLKPLLWQHMQQLMPRWSDGA